MRFARLAILGPLTLVAWAACSHDEPPTGVTRGGANAASSIDMLASGLNTPGGTRAVNKFVLSSFDTSVTDAFGRATANPPHFIADPNGYYGSTPLYLGVGANVGTYTTPNLLLPALVDADTAQSYNPYGTTAAVTYIVPGGHPGNGAGNNSWEFWYVVHHLIPGQRYIFGLARYVLVQQGALDWSEMLQTGAITQPDSLAFAPADFNPAGNKADDNGYILDCTNPAEGVPIAGANPYFIAGKTAGATSHRVIIDHTVCSDPAWQNGFGGAKSPVGANNAPPTSNQYNFFVLWKAKADSTPDYTQPVWREQIAPVLRAAGQVANNGFAPLPTVGLTAAQLVLKPGGVGRADSVKFTATKLMTLAPGAVYQTWVLVSGTTTVQKVTGRVIRLNGTTVIDTLSGVSEFTLSGGANSARVEFAFAPLDSVAHYDMAVLTIASPGGTTLPASQPYWGGGLQKAATKTGFLSLAATFGSFNGGTSTLIWGATGWGAGGLFDNELREVLYRLARPPRGYEYEAWLLNASDTTKKVDLGPLEALPPSNASLVDADTMTSLPLSGAEITQSGFRDVAANPTYYCSYDLVEVLLRPKVAIATALPPTVVLKGTNARVGCP